MTLMEKLPTLSFAAFGRWLLAGLSMLLFGGAVIAAAPALPEGEALRTLVVGKWKFKLEHKIIKGSGVTEYKADGTMISKGSIEVLGETTRIDVEGKWTIKGTKLIWEVIKTNDPELFAIGEKHTEQILSIDAKAMRYRDDDGMIWDEERLTQQP